MSKACRVFKFVAPGCVIVMAIVNGTMIPLARMERGCPQSGRGRGQEIVSCGGYIHGTPNGVLMHRLNSYFPRQKNAIGTLQSQKHVIE